MRKNRPWLSFFLSFPLGDGFWFFVILILTGILAFALDISDYLAANETTVMIILRMALPFLICILILAHGLIRNLSRYCLPLGFASAAAMTVFFHFGLEYLDYIGDQLASWIATTENGFVGLILFLLLPFVLFCLAYIPILVLILAGGKLVKISCEELGSDDMYEVASLWLTVVYWLCAVMYTVAYIGVNVLQSTPRLGIKILLLVFILPYMTGVSRFMWRKSTDLFGRMAE